MKTQGNPPKSSGYPLAFSFQLSAFGGAPVLADDLPAFWAGILSFLRPFTSNPRFHGGGERDRTDDILRAKQVLSQLSYTPDDWWA